MGWLLDVNPSFEMDAKTIRADFDYMDEMDREALSNVVMSDVVHQSKICGFIKMDVQAIGLIASSVWLNLLLHFAIGIADVKNIFPRNRR